MGGEETGRNLDRSKNPSKIARLGQSKAAAETPDRAVSLCWQAEIAHGCLTVNTASYSLRAETRYTDARQRSRGIEHRGSNAAATRSIQRWKTS